MAYIPDEWIQTKRKIAPSARDILFYYCSRADQDSGETNVSAERVSQELGMRKDHIDEHDRKLVREGLISIRPSDTGGRIVTLLDAWQPRAKRGQPQGRQGTSQVLGNARKTQVQENKPTSQVLGNEQSAQVKVTEGTSQELGDSSPKLGEFTQNLGDLPKTWGDSSQNLGKTPQNLGGHIRNNQLMNQLNRTRGEEPPALVDEPNEFDHLKALISKATGEVLANGAELRIERAAIAIQQAAGADACKALNEYIDSQGNRAIKLNFLAGDFCSWNAARKRPATQSVSRSSAVHCKKCRDNGFYGTPTGVKECDCPKGVAYAGK